MEVALDAGLIVVLHDRKEIYSITAEMIDPPNLRPAPQAPPLWRCVWCVKENNNSRLSHL